MSSLAELVCVPPNRVSEIWTHVRHYIVKAMERGGSGTIEDIEEDVFQGDAQVWVAWDGFEIICCAVTILQGEGAGKFCNLLAVGGKERARWVPLLSGIEQFAVSEGCRRLQLTGRDGWRRVLPHYKVKRVVLEKELG